MKTNRFGVDPITEDMLFGLAEKHGFTHFGKIAPAALTFREEVRAMCAVDRCHNYGKSWSCPPYCGTLEQSRQTASAFKKGVLLQVTGQMEDEFDGECIRGTALKMQTKLRALTHELHLTGGSFLVMGAGACSLCEKCSCPDAPCRFPKERIISMEAYGLVVSDVCRENDIPYNYGKNTITYTACILFDEK